MSFLTNGKKSISNLKDVVQFVSSNELIKEVERLRSIDESWIPKTIEIPADMEKGKYKITSVSGTRGRLHYVPAMTWFQEQFAKLKTECETKFKDVHIVDNMMLFIDLDKKVRDPQLALKEVKKEGEPVYKVINDRIVENQ